MNLESIRLAHSGSDVADHDTLDDIPMLILVPKRPLHSFVCRTIDIVVSIMTLILLLPLFAIIALAIKLTSRGPVLFMQERVGRNGKLFKLYKFRSMVVGAEAQRNVLEGKNERGEVVFKIKEDPR